MAQPPCRSFPGSLTARLALFFCDGERSEINFRGSVLRNQARLHSQLEDCPEYFFW